jgi:hypothetical protein
MARLNAEIGKIMQDPAAKEQFLQQGVYTLPPADAGRSRGPAAGPSWPNGRG